MRSTGGATTMAREVLFPAFFPTKTTHTSSNGVERTAKSKSLFHLVLSVLLVLCSMSTHALYETSAAGTISRDRGISGNEGSSVDNTDQIVWEYLVKKFSASGRSLTAEELSQMARSMQKCGTNVGNSDVMKEQHGAVSSPSSEQQSKRKYDPNSYHSVHVSNCKSIMSSIIIGGSSDNAGKYARHYNQSSFEQICPRLLYYIGNTDCCTEDDNVSNNSNDKSRNAFSIPSVSVRGGGIGEGENAYHSSIVSDSRLILKKEKPTSGEVWGYGFLLVTIISCSSLVGVSLMPFMAKDFYKHLLTVMIGLAVGSLTGSAVFHLLPQALRLSEHDPDHSYLHISLVVVGGIWLFFMIERILKFIMDYKERKGKNWKREKMSSVLASSPESSTIAVMTENGNLMKGSVVGEANGEQRNSLIFPSTPRDTGVIYECQEQAIKASFGHQEKPSSCHHDHHVTFEQGKDSVIATVAWMIIFGDGLHNFIDGLSIGAAFNESIWTGVSISVAVLCEELPHELGDFAVLLNAGMSMRQAVTYNFLSACTCYIGMAVGILLGEIQASSYIFALAGGMFLYISLVDMVPEMNEIAQETSKISVKKGLLTLLLQNLGLFAGISALYVLALYQDSFQF